jgi:hypothetical protein
MTVNLISTLLHRMMMMMMMIIIIIIIIIILSFSGMETENRRQQTMKHHLCYHIRISEQKVLISSGTLYCNEHLCATICNPNNGKI